MNVQKGAVPDAQRQTVLSLCEAAGEALHAGQLSGAIELLSQALNLQPADAALWLQMAALRRAQRDLPAVQAALQQVLRLEPRNFLALLMTASLLDADGQAKQAALAYGCALAVAPPDQQLDPATLRAVQRARSLNREHVGGLRQHLNSVLAGRVGDADSDQADRLRQFIDITVGLKPRYRQEPTDFFYPGLPATEFWSRQHFPWLDALEQQTLRIQGELAAVLADSVGFAPYVDYSDTIPMDQWAVLNRSLDWSAFHFFHQGQRYQDNCVRCPGTLAALAAVPQPRAQGRMPAAMFSVLKPKTRIPPHTGVANVRLVVHLPLIVPPGCGFRVGNTTREWRVGEAWVFDDTIEHEAWNLSEQQRVILIFDVWNPLLSEWEREAISAAMAAMDEFNEFVPDNSGI